MRSLILAHRGAPRGRPHNSLAAFRSLGATGIDGVELDVQVTADGTPVAAHDLSIGGHRIESLTYPELRELQGEFMSDDERIPKLEEVLRVLPAEFLVDLELKSPDAGPALLSAITGAHSRYRIVVTSFDAQPLLTLRREAPEIRTGLVSGFRIANPLARIREALADVVSLEWGLATPGLVEEMHDNGVAVFVWTVNTEAGVERMAALGVDAVITDDPDMAVSVMDRLYPRPHAPIAV